MLYLGVDPGANGAIAVLDEQGHPRSAALLRDYTDHDLSVFLAGLSRQGAVAVIERVRSSPQMGVVSAFSFGGIYRALKMALTCHAIPFEEVQPKDWQRALGVIYPKGVKRNKNITKARAQALFPAATITHAIADALLLAEFGRRTHSRGTPHVQEPPEVEAEAEAYQRREAENRVANLARARAASGAPAFAPRHGRPGHPAP